MRISMLTKSLLSGIFLFLFLLLAGNASSEVEPIYAGWAVGVSWNGYGTILRSTDSGKTWIRQGAGQIADADLGGVFATDPYTAWVVGDSDSGYGTIYHTTDGGITWDRKGSSDSASADYIPDVNFVKVHVVGNDVWVISQSTILHTSNGGATWMNHMPLEYEDIGLQGLYVLDSNTVWVGGGTREMSVPDNYGIILKTSDAGLTWTSHEINLGEGFGELSAFLGISAANADTAWAVGGEGYHLLKTTDGGTNWTQQSNGIKGMGDLNEVYAVDSSIVWVAADTCIYWTTNGGESWESSFDHGLSGSIAYNGISAVGAQKAWTSYYDGTKKIGYIAYTTDGGDTWTTVEQLDDEDLPGFYGISFATQPIYPDYLIISLIEDVEQLVDDGILNKGQGNAINVKLEKALDRLDDRL